MGTDWEQYLEKQDQRAKFARRLSRRLIFGLFLVIIGWQTIIALKPESMPEADYSFSENEVSNYSGTDDCIYITSDGAADAIMITSSADSIAINFDASTFEFEIVDPNE